MASAARRNLELTTEIRLDAELGVLTADAAHAANPMDA